MTISKLQESEPSSLVAEELKLIEMNGGTRTVHESSVICQQNFTVVEWDWAIEHSKSSFGNVIRLYMCLQVIFAVFHTCTFRQVFNTH